MAKYGKNRYWTAICYPENMRRDWQENVEGLLQVPFAYCVHDKGLELESGEERKVHVHVVLVFNAPTTQSHAYEIFDRLSAPRKTCLPFCEPVYNIDRMYKYLIHDTEDARKKGKYQFDRSERHEGNCFDIGAYIQVSKAEKDQAFDDLTDLILKRRLTNFADFVAVVYTEFSEKHDLYRDIVRGWSGYFERLIKGQYHSGKNQDWADYCKKVKEKQHKSGDGYVDHDQGQGDGEPESAGFDANDDADQKDFPPEMWSGGSLE